MTTAHSRGLTVSGRGLTVSRQGLPLSVGGCGLFGALEMLARYFTVAEAENETNDQSANQPL